MIQNGFPFCDDEQAGDLFPNEPCNDPCEELYRYLNNMDERDSSYKEKKTVYQLTDDKKPTSSDGQINTQISSILASKNENPISIIISPVRKPKQKRPGDKMSNSQQFDIQQEPRSSTSTSHIEIEAYRELQDENRSKYAETENMQRFFFQNIESIHNNNIYEYENK